MTACIIELATCFFKKNATVLNECTFFQRPRNVCFVSVEEVQTFLLLIAEERIQRDLDGATWNENVFQVLAAHYVYNPAHYKAVLNCSGNASRTVPSRVVLCSGKALFVSPNCLVAVALWASRVRRHFLIPPPSFSPTIVIVILPKSIYFLGSLNVISCILSSLHCSIAT